MRLTTEDFRKKRFESDYFRLPKHLLHDKKYQNIGATEVFAYAFMVDLADNKTEDSFIFKKAKENIIKHWLNVTDYLYKQTINRLIQNQIIIDCEDKFIVKNVYLPVQDVKEEDLYYS